MSESSYNINMSENSLVSIITPVYNADKYISETIESVLAQTYQNWELILVDDASSDTSVNVINKYIQINSRIHLIEKNSNNGPALCRQTAIENASGRYIAFLDADDLWLPEKIEMQLDFMKKTNCALSYTQFRRINHDATDVGKLIDIETPVTYKKLLKNTTIATSTVIYDKKVVGDVNIQNVKVDDFVLWLQILKKGIKACGLKKDLMRYRVLSNSHSRNKIKAAYRTWRVYRDVEKLNILRSAWFFMNYAANAYVKYLKF